MNFLEPTFWKVKPPKLSPVKHMLITDIIDNLPEAQLATLIQACGYAIRNNTVLSTALSECDAKIPQLQDDKGDFNTVFENVIDDFDLANLSILCASKLCETFVMIT